MSFFYLIFIILLFCTSCSMFQYKQKEFSKNLVLSASESVDLSDSITVIKSLIHTKELYKVLLPQSTPQSIDLLIENFSPAEIAFEAEVLNQELLCAVIFFKPSDAQWQKLSSLVEKMAQEYKQVIKFVIINSEKLFKLAEKAEIETIPTVLIIAQREEKARLELTPPMLDKDLHSTLAFFIKEQVNLKISL